jgi:glycine cleavage system H protein
VVEANPALADNPGLVNGEAFGSGWFFKLRFSAPAELNGLLSADQYRSQIGAA